MLALFVLKWVSVVSSFYKATFVLRIPLTADLWLAHSEHVTLFRVGYVFYFHMSKGVFLGTHGST